MPMNIQKTAAEKKLRTAPSSKFSAVRIDKDSTAEEKNLAVRELMRDLENLNRKNQSVTVILVND